MGTHSNQKQILLVEDDRDIREALCDVLELEGYGVVTASNGQEALDLLRNTQSPPNLILLDLMMPVKDGFQFRSEQVADQTLSGIPVIVMSADHNVERKSLELNLSNFLKKPVEIDALLSAIQSKCG